MSLTRWVSERFLIRLSSKVNNVMLVLGLLKIVAYAIFVDQYM